MGWGVGSRIMVVVKLFVFGLNYILMEYFLVLLFSFYFFFCECVISFLLFVENKNVFVWGWDGVESWGEFFGI